MDDKKCLFDSAEVGQIINSQWTDQSIKDEYDLRGVIRTLQIMDVDYA